MAHPVMTARWSNVVMATWVAPVGAVARYMPVFGRGGAERTGGAGADKGGLEVDVFGRGPLVLGDGRGGAAVSLVARRVTGVRVMGVGWPRMRTFNSVSLTICVKERGSGRRGVVVVREIVSNKGIAWCLRKWYNQPCAVARVVEEVKQQTLLIGAEYRVDWPQGGRGGAGNGMPGAGSGPGAPAQIEMEEHMARIVGRKPAVRIGAGGAEEKTQSANGKSQIEEDGEPVEAWLTERPFVFGLDRHGAGLVYEVIHPIWGIHPAVDSSVRVDFGAMFGPELGFLSGMAPAHVMLAVGSDVAMFPVRGETAGVRWGERRVK